MFHRFHSIRRLLLLAVTTATACAAPQILTLWPAGVPNLKPDATPEKIVDGRIINVHEPSLLVFPAAPDKANGTAIILCSGGGYVRLSINPAGDAITRRLNALGVTVFSLKYRLSDYGHPAPLQDVLQAVRTVRSRAAEFAISTDRIGVMGTSAGGHLAGCAATLWEHPDGKTGGTLDSIHARPDFAILIYPVVTMTENFVHSGSRSALLGKSPAPQLADALSLEKQIRKDSPPFFIVATMADTVVPVMNSLSLYQALTRAAVPSEMHLYAQGNHGSSLDPQYPPTDTWPLRLEEWLRSNRWLPGETRKEPASRQ